MIEKLARGLVGRRTPDASEGTGLVLPVTVALWREGDAWISQVLELDVASFGPDPDEAVDQAIDALCAYLNTLEELGERSRVFAEHSIATYVSPPAEVSVPDVPRELTQRAEFQLRTREVPVSRDPVPA